MCIRDRLNIDLGLALFPLLGVVHFDLIVSSLLDGISGDFDVVNLTGLASGYAASYGVVAVSYTHLGVSQTQGCVVRAL